jgi:hypothetical protein
LDTILEVAITPHLLLIGQGRTKGLEQDVPEWSSRLTHAGNQKNRKKDPEYQRIFYSFIAQDAYLLFNSIKLVRN